MVYKDKVYVKAPQTRMCDGCDLCGTEDTGPYCNDKEILEEATKCCMDTNEDNWFIWKEVTDEAI